MLLAPGATWSGGLAAEEFHVLPTLAQRPAAAVRAQIAESALYHCLPCEALQGAFVKIATRRGTQQAGHEKALLGG